MAVLALALSAESVPDKRALPTLQGLDPVVADAVGRLTIYRPGEGDELCARARWT